MKLHNRKELMNRRKELRNNATLAERFLWLHLRHSQFEGRKFRRQHSIGQYVVDFYCPEERLAVELDGLGHFTESGLEYDKKRTEYIEDKQITVIRFENQEVLYNMDGVLEEIRKHFKMK
jgi:very-short-patch-repair endonuclease